MKKTYICPQIEEMKLNANYTLLAGSVQDKGNGKLGVSIFDDSSSSSETIEEGDTY